MKSMKGPIKTKSERNLDSKRPVLRRLKVYVCKLLKKEVKDLITFLWKRIVVGGLWIEKKELLTIQPKK